MGLLGHRPKRRRTRTEIWIDILKEVRAAEQRHLPVPPSRIQTRVNVPHERFWRHVAAMERHGLLESDPWRSTRDGRRFLFDTENLHPFLDEDHE